MDKQALGLKIRQIRNKRGLSQEDLAGEARIGRKTLEVLEAGAGNPTIDTLVALSTALDFPLNDFISAGVGKSIKPLPDLSVISAALLNLSQLDTDFQRIVWALILGDVDYMRGRPELEPLIPKIQALLKIRS